MSTSKGKSIEHICYCGTADNHSGVLVDHGIPDLASHIIALIVGGEHLTTDPGREFLKVGLRKSLDVKTIVYCHEISLFVEEMTSFFSSGSGSSDHRW